MPKKKGKKRAKRTAKASQNAEAPQPEVNVKRGPRKKRSTPALRFTTHKVRAAWFEARASYPVREADVDRLVRERRKVRAAIPAVAGVNWQMVGPSNIGGRTTSIAVHPTQTDTLYIGAAGGGVWRSDDAGVTWSSQWQNQPVLNVGSLAIDPNAPDTVYCGTGEANGSADSYPGVGIYKTQNGGKTWTLLASAKSASLPRRIGVIAIDPHDSTHLILGGVTHAAEDPSAMFTSHDGGKTWTREVFFSTGDYWCHSVVFHPTAPGVIFATIDEQSARNGIWRSDDNGKNWQQLTKGLPTPSLMGRTSLAIAPSKPDTIYAITASSDEKVLGVFKSTNRGASWTSIGGKAFAKEGQMTYGNCIVVHPTNPNRVLCGGVDLHLTTDGGKTWTQATKWDAERGKPVYAHADHHALVMPAAKAGRIYDANDGGMDFSEDGGATWSNRSNGLAATMFYDIDVAQTDGEQFGGGAQDNGTIMTSDGKPDDFFEVLGGDGGWMVFDPKDATHFYASYYNFNIFRWKNGQYADVTPKGLSDEEHSSVWMVFIVMDPNDSNTVFTASNRVWRTQNDGVSWTAVSPVLDGASVSAIEVASANSKYVFAGTEKGGIFRSLDGGNTWSGNVASSTLPGTIITRIDTHPTNAKVLYVTVGGAGHPHLFRSDDAGTTWRDASAGQLPDSPHHAIVIRPDQPDTLWVASDAGVFESRNQGSNWSNISANLPNTMFVDLVFQQKDQTLTTATYGRSMWRTNIS
jgi:photosystem II stability/assembly factor-like uncharacterized protein